MMESKYADAWSLARDVAQAIRPPPPVLPVDVAAEVVNVRRATGRLQKWSAGITPYLVEPLNAAVVPGVQLISFMGPAQSGKTQALLDALLAYYIHVAPCDCAIVQPGQKQAEDYSVRRIDRMIQDSPDLKKSAGLDARTDNRLVKILKGGAMISVLWPTATQLSGRPLQVVLLTDYDRMPRDIPGLGAPIAGALQRTTTFGRAALVLAESSPSDNLTQREADRVVLSGAHQAIVPTGISGLYNSGDRRRRYWQCLSCSKWWMVPCDPSALVWVERGGTIRDVGCPCPHCGHIHEPKYKAQLSRSGVWVPEGATPESASPPKGPIASYWMSGAEAAFVSWQALALQHVADLAHFQKTGDGQPLRDHLNLDWGSPAIEPEVVGKSAELQDALARRRDSALMAGDTRRGVVPEEAAFLIATVDVQGNRFEAATLWFALDGSWGLVDRSRLPELGDVSPGADLACWGAVTEYVLRSWGDGKVSATVVGVDTGGVPGVDARVKEWAAVARKAVAPTQVWLLKGEFKPDSSNVPVIRSGAKGELWLVHTNRIKDTVSVLLTVEPGSPGAFHLPGWVEDRHILEITAETRLAEGWKRRSKAANETWDLLVAARAIYTGLGGDSLAGAAVRPSWAKFVSRTAARSPGSRMSARDILQARSLLGNR